MYPIVQFPARSLTWDAFDRIVGWYFRRIFRGQQTHSIRTKALENGNAGRVEFSKVGIIKRLICEFFWGHNNTIEWQNQPSLKDLAEVNVNKGKVWNMLFQKSTHKSYTYTWRTFVCMMMANNVLHSQTWGVLPSTLFAYWIRWWWWWCTEGECFEYSIVVA